MATAHYQSIDDPDSDREEDEPSAMLQTWLGELDSLKKGLDLPVGVTKVQMRNNNNNINKEQAAQYRCSLINIENSEDDELDAILGELTELETQFSKEISKDEPKTSTGTRSGPANLGQQDSSSAPRSSSIQNGGQRILAGTNSQQHQHGASNGSRNCSPEDTDSAFCDNLSVLSSCSADSTNNQADKKSSGVSSTGSNSSATTSTVLSPEEESARLKAERIKIAIEKIKEASVKKLFIKVFTSDGSAKSLLVDEKMSVGQVTRILAEKNHVPLDPKWALVELIPDLYMERVYEDHEQLVENCLLWKVDSKNTLWFIERPEKFDLFSRPEIYLLGGSHQHRAEPMEEHCRQELLEEYFSTNGVVTVGAPQVEGYAWLKSENKKSWKRFHFVLRTSGLYYSPVKNGSKKSSSSKDLQCLCTFDVNQVYYGVGWKRKFKAPTDFCFGIKHPQIQAKNPKYIRYLCVDTQRELHRWVTGIRIAKNGTRLYSNYRALVEEIAHADLDFLVGKRGSLNSGVGSTCGIMTATNRAASCSTNLHLSTSAVTAPSSGNFINSPVMTPLSENRSFDSAVSSGIRSEHFTDSLPASTFDLARFDAHVANSDLPPYHQPQSTGHSPLGNVVGGGVLPGNSILKRTSKSSSSLSDKSSGVAEQGFESDHPVGGTIKKRPPIFNTSMEDDSTAGWATNPDSYDAYSGNIRLGAGGTLLRRSTSAERVPVASAAVAANKVGTGRNYEELQLLLDEIHSNVQQAKDIQAKISGSGLDANHPEDSGTVNANELSSMGGQCETPPPPPPRTSSRLSLDEESLFPPPPPELQTPTAKDLSPVGRPPLQGASTFESGNYTKPATPSLSGSATLGRRKQLPPIAPKPTNLAHRLTPGSPKFKSSGSQPPLSYGTLPNPGRRSPRTYSVGSQSSVGSPLLAGQKSGRRISFDDNIQLIEDGDSASMAARTGTLSRGNGNDGGDYPQPHKLTASSFSQGLEQVISSRLPPCGQPPGISTFSRQPGSGHQQPSAQSYDGGQPLQLHHSGQHHHQLFHHSGGHHQQLYNSSGQHQASPGTLAVSHCGSSFSTTNAGVSEPLYTAVRKQSACGGSTGARPARYLPGSCGGSGGNPALGRVCCVGGAGDSSPDHARYLRSKQEPGVGGSSMSTWRQAHPNSGDYWHVEQPDTAPADAQSQSFCRAMERQAASYAHEPGRQAGSNGFCRGQSSGVEGPNSQRSACHQEHPHLPQSRSFSRSLSESVGCGGRRLRSGSEEPPSGCGGRPIPAPAKERHSSVPSSPSSSNRLWSSFRGKKPPHLDKRNFSPHMKSAS